MRKLEVGIEYKFIGDITFILKGSLIKTSLGNYYMADMKCGNDEWEDRIYTNSDVWEYCRVNKPTKTK